MKILHMGSCLHWYRKQTFVRAVQQIFMKDKGKREEAETKFKVYLFGTPSGVPASCLIPFSMPGTCRSWSSIFCKLLFSFVPIYIVFVFKDPTETIF